MKVTYFLLLLAFSALTANAQKKTEIREMYWGKDDAYKAVTAIPEKWKNESAVVIYKNESYDFHKFGKNVTYTSSIRKRVKLLDQAAVNEFSEFSYSEISALKGVYSKGDVFIGIKVVKVNGKEIEIDVDKVSVKADDVKKIAIGNLEPGDIIDFYSHSIDSFQSIYDHGFEPVETNLGDIYPIMTYKLTFRTENDFFVNFASYNGAPELKEIATGKSNDRLYEFTATDIAKNDFPRWFYPLVELPSYKFQVFFARSGKFEKMADAFLPEKENIIKKTVSREDVFNFYDNKFRPYGDLGDIEKFLKGKTFASQEEKVREVYYFTRHHYFTRYVEAFVVNEAKIMYPFEYYGNNPIFFNTEQAFINHFMAFLKDNKLEYDIIIGTKRFNGPIKDLLIQQNLTVLLKVNLPNPVYLEFFTPFTSADQFDEMLENSEAYALKVSNRKKIVDVETVTLPGSTYKDNRSVQTINVNLNADITAVEVNKECSLFGHLKDDDQADKMEFFDYVAEDYKKYDTKPLMERVSNKKKREQYTKEFDALVNKLKDKQKENFKKATSDEFGFQIDNHKLEITNTGRFGKAQPFAYKETFVIKDDLIKRAGDNYMFEIGKFIGSQVDIEKKEYDRTNNVYEICPRSFENEIVFQIPAGYTVSGIEKLNKKVENETGGFISTAKIQGDKLIVKTQKYYANYFEPNKNWKKMVAFLEEAYQFTQEKILLKKS